MKLGNFKNFSLKKKDADTPPDDVLIESTTAEQIAEMKQKLAGRTKDLETAKSQITGLSRPAEDDDDDDDDDEKVGPHPPLQELTLEDIDEDDDDDFVLAPDEEPVQTVNLSGPKETEANEDEDAEDEEEEEEDALSGDGDDLKNLFSSDEEEEHPLANLINFLPDVSVQELVDDIDEIKSIIREWQQQR